MQMMAKHSTYYKGLIDATGECEGSGSSGRIDVEISEASTAPFRKCINLYSEGLSFNVHLLAYLCSDMSPFEKKNLASRLRAELVQVQTLQKKIEQPKNFESTRSASSDILSCSNRPSGQFGIMPITSTIKSKVNKKLNSVKVNDVKRGWNRGTTGRFEPAGNAANTALMKKCESLLKRLMAHQYGWVFNVPVDIVKLNIPDYFTIIKHPMDLGTIKKKLSSGLYPSPLEFFDDVRLTFSNAMTYNPPGNDVHIMAETLNQLFEYQSKDIEKKLQTYPAKPVPAKSNLQKEIPVYGALPPSKKMKLTSEEPVVISKPVIERIMSEQEKNKLSLDLEALIEDMPTSISDFLRHHSSGVEIGEDEIEIDIDALSDDILFKLREKLDDHLKHKQTDTYNEPSEIELVNESGLSNLSMPTCKGDILIDEDVDVGENDHPVSSYPLVELEKDAEHKSKCTNYHNSNLYDNGTKCLTISEPGEATKAEDGANMDSNITDGNQMNEICAVSISDLGQKSSPVDSDKRQDGGESVLTDGQVSPDKVYRATVLNIGGFTNTVLKAHEKTFKEDETGDPEKLCREKEELELQQRKEKARLQAEAKAADDAKKRAEEEAKHKRDLEREDALLKMMKSADISENLSIIHDMEMRTVVPTEQLPSSVVETSPEHADGELGATNNPLEQLGLFIKQDEVSAVSKDIDDGLIKEGQ